MRLLFVHQILGEFGGAEANILTSARELQSRGHELALLYGHSSGRNETGWRKVFKGCYLLPPQGNLEVLEAVLETFSPDVVYLHNLSNLEILGALLNSELPVVRMVHDHSLYCMRSYKYNYFTRKPCMRPASWYCVFPCLGGIGRNREGLFPLKFSHYRDKRRELELSRRCNQLVAYSEYQKQELIRNGFEPERIQVCVPIRHWNQQNLTSSFSERNLVLFAGQLIRGKGVDALLRALAQVKVRFEAIILGDGNHRRTCERLCKRLGQQDRVKFLGYVPPEELRSYYLDASVFVMSSLWPEPFGMAGPEAMQYGLPVVAFDAGAIPEWLQDGENGFLVPWNATSQFARRIEELLCNKELARQIGQRARRSVEQYDTSRQISVLEQVFERARDERALVRSPVVGSETSFTYD